MLKQISNLRDFKCGEVLCLSSSEYHVDCYLCREKVLFESFPSHFRSKHLGIMRDEHDNGEPEHDPFATIGEQIKCEVIVEEEVLPNEPETVDVDKPVKITIKPSKQFVVEKPSLLLQEELKQQESDEFDAEDDLPLLSKLRLRVKSNVNVEANKTRSTTEHKNLITEQFSSPHEEKADINNAQAALSVTAAYNSEQQNSESDFVNDADDWQSDTAYSNDSDEEHKTEAAVESFSCSICSKQFDKKSACTAHRRTHKKTGLKSATSKKPERNFKCDFEGCDKAFSTEIWLRNHKFKHTGIICDICGKQFKQIQTLSNHRIRHTDNKKFSCELCDYRAFTMVEVRAHMISHTGILPHICDVCGIRCRSSGDLNRHKRRHTGEKPYKCEVCGKCFFSGTLLNEHKISHTDKDDRPFQCHCGVRTKNRKALRVHQKAHETVHPFECQQCGRTFAKERGLHYHMICHEKGVVMNMKLNTVRRKRLKKAPIQEQDRFFEMMHNLDEHMSTIRNCNQ